MQLINFLEQVYCVRAVYHHFYRDFIETLSGFLTLELCRGSLPAVALRPLSIGVIAPSAQWRQFANFRTVHRTIR